MSRLLPVLILLPAPGADPRADLEAVDVGSETWIANLALGGCAPFAIDGRQPELVAHALGLEQAARREPEGQRVAVVRDLEEAVQVCDRPFAELRVEEHRARRRRRAAMVLGAQVGRSAARAQP